MFVTNVDAGKKHENGKPPKPGKTLGQLFSESSFRKQHPTGESSGVDKDGWPLGLPKIADIVRKLGNQKLSSEFGSARTQFSELSDEFGSAPSHLSELSRTGSSSSFQSAPTHVSELSRSGSTSSFQSAQSHLSGVADEP